MELERGVGEQSIKAIAFSAKEVGVQLSYPFGLFCCEISCYNLLGNGEKNIKNMRKAKEKSQKFKNS